MLVCYWGLRVIFARLDWGGGYLVGRCECGADAGEALDGAVFAELFADFGAGLLFDGAGEGEVRDVGQEGFVQAETWEMILTRASGGLGGSYTRCGVRQSCGSLAYPQIHLAHRGFWAYALEMSQVSHGWADIRYSTFDIRHSISGG